MVLPCRFHIFGDAADARMQLPIHFPALRELPFCTAKHAFPASESCPFAL